MSATEEDLTGGRASTRAPMSRPGPSGPSLNLSSPWVSVLAPAAGIAVALALWWFATEVLASPGSLMRTFSPARTWTGLGELW